MNKWQRKIKILIRYDFQIHTGTIKSLLTATAAVCFKLFYHSAFTVEEIL